MYGTLTRRRSRPPRTERPTSEASGRPSVPPEHDLRQELPVTAHFPEEVVRREEHEVAAAVAVALDDVVGVLGHVLGVAGEDDEVVGARRARPRWANASRSSSERKSTCFPVRFSQAMKSRSQSRKRNGTPKSRNGPREVDAPSRVADVPAVAPAVAVRVPEVVGLPGVRREHDRNARAGRHRVARRTAHNQRARPEALSRRK